MASRDIPHATFARPPQPHARSFLTTFLAIALPAVAVLVAFTLHQSRVQGDLTRVGGYSENEYGWTATHARFDPPLVSTVYDRPYDVVVVGDSYSLHSPGGQTDPGAYWTNRFAQLTGLSVVAINQHRMPLRLVMEHPIYKRSPPRLVILQMVERYLMRNLEIQPALWIGEGFDGCPVPGPSPRVKFGEPVPAEPVAWTRPDGVDFNFARAVDVLWKSSWRRFGGINPSEAHTIPLDRSSFFSSRAADRLLVYGDEFEIADWPRAQIDATLCRLRAAQAEVEADGRTAFLFMATPNKLTVYNQYVADLRFRDISKLGEIYADRAINQVRLLEPLRAALRCGTVDLYLPNDTHWGIPAHEIVARATVAHLTGAPAPSPQCPDAGGRKPDRAAGTRQHPARHRWRNGHADGQARRRRPGTQTGSGRPQRVRCDDPQRAGARRDASQRGQAEAGRARDARR